MVLWAIHERESLCKRCCIINRPLLACNPSANAPISINSKSQSEMEKNIALVHFITESQFGLMHNIDLVWVSGCVCVWGGGGGYLEPDK